MVPQIHPSARFANERKVLFPVRGLASRRKERWPNRPHSVASRRKAKNPTQIPNPKRDQTKAERWPLVVFGVHATSLQLVYALG